MVTKNYKNFILGYFFGCFLFFLTSEQSLDLAKMENTDLRLIQNEIEVLNLTTTTNAYESSIYDVKQVSAQNQE